MSSPASKSGTSKPSPGTAPPTPKRGPLILPSGYRTKTHSWWEGDPTPDSDAGNVEYTEHWDGSTDAKVQLTAIQLDLRPEDPHAFAKALAALEDATAEIRLASRSGQAEWLRYAKARHRDANERLTELQPR